MKNPSGLLLLTLSVASRARAAAWPGWGGIDYIFNFGDSYSKTGFEIDEKQPNPGNPFGNPAYPGVTSSNGPNWLVYLATEYNETYVQTYNFAHGGATLDADLIPPSKKTIPPIKKQVQDTFLPKYGKHPSSTPWESDNTLFTFFVGVNDVSKSYTKKNRDALYDKVFVEYEKLITQIHKAGGRNFLLINVPPVDLSPRTRKKGGKHQAKLAQVIESWNPRVENLAGRVEQALDDTTVFKFDAHTLYSQVLKDPKSFPETAGYRNTTAYCKKYAKGTKEGDTLIPACKIPADEYFWLDYLHPTFPVHKLAAGHIAAMLRQKGFLQWGI